MSTNSEKKPSSLTRHAIGMVVLLSLQYILGSFISFFVTFPEGESSEKLWQFAGTQFPIVFHVIFGLMLVLGTLALLIRAIVKKNKIWIIASAIASFVVLEAAIAGFIFIPTQKDTYSFMMSINFLIALLVYFWGIYKVR